MAIGEGNHQFRILPEIKEEPIQRTFENIRELLWHAIHADDTGRAWLRFVGTVWDDTYTGWTGEAVIRPESWMSGLLDVRFYGYLQDPSPGGFALTVALVAYPGISAPPAPDVLGSKALTTGGAGGRVWKTDSLEINPVDLTPYTHIGVQYSGYSNAAVPLEPNVVTTQVYFEP